MKILFLCKRHYTSADVFDGRYGRLYEIPRYLAELGHVVELVCHSYRGGLPEDRREESGNFALSTWNLGAEPVSGFWRHARRLERLAGSYRPEVIIGASDCFQVILASRLARRRVLPFVADLYDNFASFGAARLPGVHPLYSRALNHADAITVVSGELLRLVRDRYRAPGRLYLVENAASGPFLENYDRAGCRGRFGFAPDRRYVGTAGALSRAKGIDVLLDAFEDIGPESGMDLVLAGRRDRRLAIPARENIHYLGELAHDEIPQLFTALDLGVICIRDDEFGRYCFPQKFPEMAACGLPLVAADVGEMRRLLAGHSECLYAPDDREDLKQAIREQVISGERPVVEVPGWRHQADKFDQVLRAIC